jgi:hypothetical protein
MKLIDFLSENNDPFADEGSKYKDWSVSRQALHWENAIQSIIAMKRQAMKPVGDFFRKHGMENAGATMVLLHPMKFEAFEYEVEGQFGKMIPKQVHIPVSAVPSPKAVFNQWRKIYDRCADKYNQYDQLHAEASQQLARISTGEIRTYDESI